MRSTDIALLLPATAAAAVVVWLAFPAAAEQWMAPAKPGGFSDLSNSKGTLIQIPGVKSMKPKFTAPAPDTSVASTDGEPVFKPGDVLPNQYMMLFNAGKYGLDRPKDGWVYFTVGPDIYRANLNSRIVLERMAQKIE